MTNRKGPDFEREATNVALDAGFGDASRAPKTGAKDEGDIIGIPHLTVEAKNRHPMDVPGAVDEALVEQANAGTDWYVAVIKRRGKHARHAYAVKEWRHELEQYHEVLAARRLRALLEAAEAYVFGNSGDEGYRRLVRAVVQAQEDTDE